MLGFQSEEQPGKVINPQFAVPKCAFPHLVVGAELTMKLASLAGGFSSQEAACSVLPFGYRELQARI